MLLLFQDDQANGFTKALELVRLDIALESLFAGFDLDLYNNKEWLYIYWFGQILLNGQLEILSGLDTGTLR